MKVNPLACAFLLLLAAIFPSFAQQASFTNRLWIEPTIQAPDGSVIKVEVYEGDIDWFISTNVNKTKLAEDGNPTAQVAAGYFCITGYVLEWDGKSSHKSAFKVGVTNSAEKAAEAVKWFRMAAEQGHWDAEHNLGVCYANGIGMPMNETEAAKWYHKATIDEFKETKTLAELGDADAQFKVGMMAYKGEDAPKDFTEAYKWFQKAANQGDVGAQNNLGAMYANGDGVPQDYVEAYKWFNLAAASGKNSGFIKNRDQIAENMTTEQIAEAQELSREFKPHKGGPGNSISRENPTASGTGFFITDDGYLISNYHVVKDATKVRLVTSAGLIDAKVVKVDAANDLALLKADGRFAPLPIASSRSVKLGGTVATVGFPNTGLQGFAPKFARGEIASLSGAADDARYFQISVPVQPGNSGGALVDEYGNVVGVVSAKLNAAAALAASGALPENVNYAVKSSFLLSFLESVPDVSAKLKEPNTKDEKFDEVVKSAQDAAVLVLVY